MKHIKRGVLKKSLNYLKNKRKIHRRRVVLVIKAIISNINYEAQNGRFNYIKELGEDYEYLNEVYIAARWIRRNTDIKMDVTVEYARKYIKRLYINAE